VNSCKIYSRCCVLQYINYHLKSEVAITLHCQLCSTHYQVVRIEKYLKSNCVIKVASMKNTLRIEAITELTLFAVSKDGWKTKEAVVTPWRMHYICCKRYLWVEAMSNNEKISPVFIFNDLKCNTMHNKIHILEDIILSFGLDQVNRSTPYIVTLWKSWLLYALNCWTR